MRNLERDTQPVFISRFIALVPQENEEGQLTGKHIPDMAEPEEFFPSVSIARGEAQGAYFGTNLDYDRVLTIADPKFEVGEADYIWIDNPVGDPEEENYPLPHDYNVKRVAHKGAYTIVAVKRVEVRK